MAGFSPAKAIASLNFWMLASSVTSTAAGSAIAALSGS